MKPARAGSVSYTHLDVYKRQVVFGILVLGGCARLPYTKTVVHEDKRVAVRLQAEVSPAGYSHPVEIPPPYIAAILGGLSLREQQRLPLRWFAEEVPPRRVFREDEVCLLYTSLLNSPFR